MEEQTMRKIEDVLESVQEHMRSLLTLNILSEDQNYQGIQNTFGDNENSPRSDRISRLEVSLNHYINEVSHLTTERNSFISEISKLREELSNTQNLYKSALSEIDFLKTQQDLLALKTDRPSKQPKNSKHSNLECCEIKDLEPAQYAANSAAYYIKESLDILVCQIRAQEPHSKNFSHLVPQMEKFSNSLSKIKSSLSHFHILIQRQEQCNQYLRRKLSQRDEELEKLNLSIRLKSTAPTDSIDMLLERETEIASLKKEIGNLRLENSSFQKKPPSPVLHSRHSSDISDKEKLKRELGIASMKVNKMRVMRDKALLDYEHLLNQLKQTKYALAKVQEQASENQLKARKQIKDLINALNRLGGEQNISLKGKVLIEKLLSCKKE